MVSNQHINSASAGPNNATFLAMEATLKKYESMLDACTVKMSEMTTTLSHSVSRINALETKVLVLEADMKVQRTRMRESESDLAKTRRACDDLQYRLKQVEEKNDEQKETNKQLHLELKDTKSRIRELVSEVKAIKDSNAKKDKMISDLDKSLASQDTIIAKIMELQRDANSTKEALSRVAKVTEENWRLLTASVR